jgi:peptidyl-prolyl cis-trans isomerase-like 3
VIDGFDTLDDIEKLPVKDEKKHRPVRDIRIRSVTIHANPIAEAAVG